MLSVERQLTKDEQAIKGLGKRLLFKSYTPTQSPKPTRYLVLTYSSPIHTTCIFCSLI